MKLLGFGLWLIILVVGIGIYVLAPDILEPIVCFPHESLQTPTDAGSGLYCDDDFGNSRESSQSVVVPFVFFMAGIPLLLLSVTVLNRLTTQQHIINPSEVTWSKRLMALFTSVLDVVGMFVYFVDPPDHYHVSLQYGDLWREAKAKWIYFLGNPAPLVALYEELDQRTKMGNGKKD